MASKALTVGQLRKLLRGVDDTVYVVISTDSWYDNVSAVYLPDDDGTECVTLCPSTTLADDAGDYDTRQHALSGVKPAEVFVGVC